MVSDPADEQISPHAVDPFSKYFLCGIGPVKSVLLLYLKMKISMYVVQFIGGSVKKKTKIKLLLTFISQRNYKSFSSFYCMMNLSSKTIRGDEFQYSTRNVTRFPLYADYCVKLKKN